MNERDKDITATGRQTNRTGKRLGIREFVLVLVIILVVWAAQKCYSAPSPVPGAYVGAVTLYEDQVPDRTAP